MTWNLIFYTMLLSIYHVRLLIFKIVFQVINQVKANNFHPANLVYQTNVIFRETKSRKLQ